jgi:oligoribonuclease
MPEIHNRPNHPKYDKDTKLAWLDLEMSGLDLNSCSILEIASVITDSNFNILYESSSVAICHPEEILNSMDAWCFKTHTQNGLINRCIESKIDMRSAEIYILDFLQTKISYKSSPLCGNSVWQDRRFLEKYMPELEAYFTYQMLDLATLRIIDAIRSKELQNINNYQRAYKHLALDDIKDHVAEFKYLYYKLCDEKT